MTIEEILEGNALIAIFMGAEYERKKDPFSDRYIESYIFKGSPHNWRCYNDNIKYSYIVEQTMYHTDWEWIMPVCKEFDNLYKYFKNKEYQKICDELDNTVVCYYIKDIHEQLVKCIKWYNKQEGK